MSDGADAEQLFVEEIRRGNSAIWSQLIDAYEGRLLAFCESRIGRREASEDIVQETFIGFLTSLPNYNCERSLEGYLFSICAHKLTDYLRREGRRPAIPFSRMSPSQDPAFHFPSSDRAASTIMRSEERRNNEEQVVGEVLSEMVGRWVQRGDWEKLKCIELLFVRGRANRDVARRLGLTEQQVANFKSDTLIQLRKALRTRGMTDDVRA
jgi:RNA polymerase sigma-70 factor, ECF subfamily